MWRAAGRLHKLYRICQSGLTRRVRPVGVAVSLTISAIALVACQPAPRPAPLVLTATPLPYTVTPAPTALPVHIPISLDTPDRAAIRVLNALTATPGTTQPPSLDVYLDGSPLVTRLSPDLPSDALGFQAGHFQLR